MLLQTTISARPLYHRRHACFSPTQQQLPRYYSFLASGSLNFTRKNLLFQAIARCYREPALKNSGAGNGVNDTKLFNLHMFQKGVPAKSFVRHTLMNP